MNKKLNQEATKTKGKRQVFKQVQEASTLRQAICRYQEGMYSLVGGQEENHMTDKRRGGHVPCYTTKRYWPEVAPLAPLWVTESILGSDTDSLGLMFDFKLTNVCRLDCQVLKKKNYMSVINFYSLLSVTFLWFSVSSVMNWGISWHFMQILSFKTEICLLLSFLLSLFYVKFALQSVDSPYLCGFWVSTRIVTPFAYPP